MKKVLIGLAVLMTAVYSFAANVTDVTGNEKDRIITEMRDAIHALATGGTLTNTLTVAKAVNVTSGGLTVTAGDIDAVAGQVTSYGYPAVVGHTNGSAQVIMTQFGTLENGAAVTTSTNTFPVSFIGTPAVVFSQGISDTNNVLTIASNYFTLVFCGSTNGSWIATGRVK